MSSQLVGVAAAGLVKPDGKGMETGAWIAKNATQYNFLNHERTEYLVEDIHSCKGNPSCEQDMWIGSGYNKESLENLDDALKTMGPVRAKDLMTQVQGGLAALGTLQCTTPTCESIKFELIDRSVRALESLDEVYGAGAIVVGGIAGMAGAGGSRPGAGAVSGASSNVNKAYEYWAAVRAERVAGAKATGEVVPVASVVSSGTTRTGVVRTNAADWRALRDNWDDLGYGQILSAENRVAIAKGRTLKVDDAWIKVFPEDAGLKGERIPIHHIQGSPLTVPLPDTRHLDAHMPGGFRYNPGGPGSALPAYPPKKGTE